MEKTILKTNKLTRTYGNVKALRSLSLEVQQGSIFGLLGPNGSGKTTTLGILLGINKADKGDFSWFGNGQKDENRMRIGAILETPNFYPYLSAKQNLKTVGLIKKVDNLNDRIQKVIKRVGLEGRDKDKFKTYSLGMKQRLAIGAALLSDPEVLVLDEPTNGLDPQGIADIRDLIANIAQDGKTIIIASHILDEIEKVCTHVAILRKGKLLSTGTLGEIMGNQTFMIVKSNDIPQLKLHLETISWANILSEEQNELKIDLIENKTSEDLNRALFEKGSILTEMRSAKKNLETIFLETVGK